MISFFVGLRKNGEIEPYFLGGKMLFCIALKEKGANCSFWKEKKQNIHFLFQNVWHKTGLKFESVMGPNWEKE